MVECEQGKGDWLIAYGAWQWEGTEKGTGYFFINNEGKMPRVERGLYGGCIYHLINRGNGRREIFHKENDYEAFVNLMKKAKEIYPVKVFGYCLMPNHFQA